MFHTPFTGLVIPFAGKVAPKAWMFCQGQELSISEYTDLFTIIGNTFGGDGIETFAVPNLCKRVAVHAGQAPQMKLFTAGETGGSEMVHLTVDNLPKHNHTVTISGKPKCTTTSGTEDIPAGHYPARVNGSPNAYSTTPVDTANLAATVLAVSTPVAFEQNQEAMNILSPFLIMNYIICVEGIYPSRG